MNVDLGIWDKLTRVVLLLFILAAALSIGAAYYPLLQQNERMRAVVYQLDGQIQREESQLKQYQKIVDSLTNDKHAIERLARYKLGVAKSGESIIRFEENPPLPLR